MLKEVQNPRQIPGEGRRRWFSDQFFELIVWHDIGGHITGFQLCYDIYGYERALTWKKDLGYTHDGIDSGEMDVMDHKMTPILVADGYFDREGIAERFYAESREIDRAIASFIHEKLLECSL